MKRSWPKSLLLLLMSAFLFSCSLPVQAVSSVPNILVDGKKVSIPLSDQQPFIQKGRIYVPLRVVTESLGADVTWDKNTRQVIISTAKGQAVTTPARSKGEREVRIVVDGQVLNIPSELGKPYITNKGRTVIPLRAVAVALGCQVDWNEKTRTAEITSGPALPSDNAGMSGKNTGSSPVTGNTGQVEAGTTTGNNLVAANGSTASDQSSSLLQQLAAYRTNLVLGGKLINSASLAGKSESEFTPEELSQLKTYLTQLQKYGPDITLPDGRVLAVSSISIRGESVASAQQLKEWAERNAARVQKAWNTCLPVPDLAELYLRIGKEYGIRGDIAFCQAAKETGYWQFNGQVKPEQNNYCGLWATGTPLTGNESLNGADPSLVGLVAGTHGATFATPEAGVEAHIQHLYAYASKDPLPAGKKLLDPRFVKVPRGTAVNWTDLNGRWAVPGTTYGQSIICDYWLKALTGQ